MPIAATYEQIAHESVTSGNNTVSFTNIPNTYTDLVLIASPLGYGNPPQNGDINVQFNGDTGTNYNYGRLVTTSTIVSSRANNTTIINNSDATYPGSWRIDVFNYAATDYWKHVMIVGGDVNTSGNGNVSHSIGVWRNTAAINSIQIRAETGSGQWAVNSKFTLYGIKAA
jgi:hypothetical protein